MLPYSRQWIDGRDVAHVIKVLRSDFLTQGEAVIKLEKSVSDYCEVKYSVAFSSGTAALHGACFAAGIGTGDEVITTPLTFAASANCILYMGATPVFADVQKNLPLIDPDEIRQKITKKTRAIIPVDYSGIPVDYDGINKIAKKNKLIVIADSAHSLGATYKGKKIGNLADMTVFSFHPVKTITTGEGGMVVTNNKNFYKRLCLFRTHGITKNPKYLIDKTQGPWFYEMQELGFNYRLTDIQAALGISQMKRINFFIKRRREISQKYMSAFKNYRSIKILQNDSIVKSAWHLFPIIINTKNYRQDRLRLFSDFHQAGLKVQVHYIPIHLHPFYRKRFGYKRGDFPYAERFYDGEISLPIYPKMSNKDIERVIEVTSDLIKDLE